MENDYKPLKGVKTQVFDPVMKRGEMLISGKLRLFVIQATRDRDDGSEHRPFLASESHTQRTGESWTDSLKAAEYWPTKRAAQEVVQTVAFDCTVEVMSVTLFIGKVEAA